MSNITDTATVTLLCNGTQAKKVIDDLKENLVQAKKKVEDLQNAKASPKDIEKARKEVRLYRRKCYNVLYDYFNGKSQRQQEMIDMERTLLNDKKELDETLAELMNSVSAVKAKIKSIDGKFAELQSERLNPTPSLFD